MKRASWVSGMGFVLLVLGCGGEVGDGVEVNPHTSTGEQALVDPDGSSSDGTVYSYWYVRPDDANYLCWYGSAVGVGPYKAILAAHQTLDEGDENNAYLSRYQGGTNNSDQCASGRTRHKNFIGDKWLVTDVVEKDGQSQGNEYDLAVVTTSTQLPSYRTVMGVPLTQDPPSGYVTWLGFGSAACGSFPTSIYRQYKVEDATLDSYMIKANSDTVGMGDSGGPVLFFGGVVVGVNNDCGNHTATNVTWTPNSDFLNDNGVSTSNCYACHPGGTF